MLLRSKLLLPLVVAGFGLALVTPRPAAAIFILDDFDDANTPSATTTCTTGNTCSPSSDTAGVGDFSATRATEVTDDATVTISGSGSPTKLFYSATDATADLTLTYDLGIAGVDITDGGLNQDFILGVLAVSGITSVDVRITDTGADFADVSIPIGPGAGEFSALLSAFTTANGNLDLDSVEEIRVTIANQNGTVEFDYILTPEPSTAGMMLLGLLGLAFAGGRCRTAA